MHLLKYSSRMSILMLQLLLLVTVLPIHVVHLAPAHHLKIGVEGNTPKLIVTSSEVGIAPKIPSKTNKREPLVTTTKKTAATTIETTSSSFATGDLSKTAPLHKNAQEKMKSKSHKSLYEKKRSHEKPTTTTTTRTTKDKLTMWQQQGKQEEPTRDNNSTPTLSPTPPPTTTNATQISSSMGAENVLKKSNFITSTEALTTESATKIGVTTNNEWKTLTTDKLLTTTSSASNLKASSKAENINTKNSPSSKLSNVGNEPHQMESHEATVISSGSEKGTATMARTTPTMIALTTNDKVSDSGANIASISHIADDITNNEKTRISSSASLATNDDENVKILPKAFTASPNIKEEQNVATQTMMMMTMSPPAISLITTEAKDAANDEENSNLKTASATTTNANVITETTSIKTNTNNNEDDNDEDNTDNVQAPPILGSLSTPFKLNVLANATKDILTTTTQSGDIGESTNTTTTTMMTAVAPRVTSDDVRVIKLIDLEKHEPPISIDELRTKAHTQHIDDGHDGVKQTKKKQLLDKHFMMEDDRTSTATFTTEMHTDFAIDTKTLTSTSSKQPPPQDNIDSGVKASKFELHDGVEKAKPTLTPKPILMPKPTLTPKSTSEHTPLLPVPNGFLGPIIMEEHTFKVQHNSGPTTPKHHEHEASIESKLHDGRIVEIIAPTALLEASTDTSHSSARTFNMPTPTFKPTTSLKQEDSTAVLSTTVFQVHDASTATSTTTHQPIVSEMKSNEQRESKISDIQIEIYDNVMTPNNFNDYRQETSLLEETDVGTTRPPAFPATTQERFTQYIVDRTESSTTTSDMVNSDFNGIGKPEPAAIEIHINVSEKVGNSNEDLEFSGNIDDSKIETTLLTTKPLVSLHMPQNDSTDERNDDILVVEIIDTGENSSEVQSSERMRPVVTFRADSNADIELKDIKFVSPERDQSSHVADELFMADMKQDSKNRYLKPPAMPPPPPPPRVNNVDRDSDTIFYISNTEVKVGESPANNPNDESQQYQLRRKNLENQFFPANYVASTHPNAASAGSISTSSQHNGKPRHLYEEDIILSPIRNTADTLKIFRSQGNGSPPLDVTYVGESVIEVEQSSGMAGIATTTNTPVGQASSQQTPDVIIQPAILPEMSIGVPVIGELPPQIELKEIDFMPNEANQQSSGVYEASSMAMENNDINEENLSDAEGGTGEAGGGGGGGGGGGARAGKNNNDVDRLVESSIQYGGDLIDEGADSGGGYDGIEGSYPFGNLAAMRRKTKNNDAADYAHFMMHHGVNNLRKDELSIDVTNARDTSNLNLNENGNESRSTNGTGSGSDGAFPQNTNDTQTSSTTMNVSNAVAAPRLDGNASALSVVVVPVPADVEEERQLALMHTLWLVIGLTLMFVSFLGALATFCVRTQMYGKMTRPFRRSGSSEMQLPNGTINRSDGGEGGEKDSESDLAPRTTTQPQQPPPPQPSSSSSSSGSGNEESFQLKTINGQRYSLPPSDDNLITKPSNNSSNLNDSHSSTNRKSNFFNVINEKHIVGESSLIQPRKIAQSNNDQGYTGPNGSVTKMTLKNNHLIVETEERNDISRDARETKMHYNTSEKDGVFVVEVSRGVDSKMIPESPITELAEDHLTAFPMNSNETTFRSPSRKYQDEPAVLNNHEQVQVHQPPTELHKSSTAERSLHQIDEVEEEAILSPKSVSKIETVAEVNMTQANTGLSQSDLSSTSSSDSNKRYSYGNQELYTIDQADYSQTSAVATNLPSTIAKAGETQEDDDHKSENGQNLEQSPEKANGNNGMDTEEKEQTTNEENEEIKKIPENKIINNSDKEALVDNEEINSDEPTLPLPDTTTTTTITKMETSEDDSKDENESENENENMSISEVEMVAVESVTSETDITQKLIYEMGQIQDAELSAQGETDPEYAYDSLMSLPDPPSNEEINQLSDFNGVESNSQLDSLPPPPPPASLLVVENCNMPDIVAEIKSKPSASPALENGNANGNGNLNGEDNGSDKKELYNGHQKLCNGQESLNDQQLEENNCLVSLPPPLSPPPPMDDINSNGKMLQGSPLTPPESPPPSPPIQYSNGVLGICGPNIHAVAVDVNGS